MAVGERRRDFTFRQLSSFVAAARSGSFALAADQLGISQPAISDHISALEAHLGQRLFERRRGTTPKLTREGIDMLHRAESLLRTSDAMRGDDAGASEQRKVRVRVAVGPRLREVYLKPLLPRLYADHPHVEIELAPILPLRAVPQALERGEIDLLFYTVGAVPDFLPNVRHILDAPISIVVAPSLAEALETGERRLDDTPFVLIDNGVVSERWIERQLEAVGVVPRHPIRYVEFSDVVQTMAEEGLGAAVLMREQVAPAIAGGRLVAIGPALPSMRRIIVRAQKAPAVTKVIETALVRAVQGEKM